MNSKKMDKQYVRKLENRLSLLKQPDELLAKHVSLKDHNKQLKSEMYSLESRVEASEQDLTKAKEQVCHSSFG